MNANKAQWVCILYIQSLVIVCMTLSTLTQMMGGVCINIQFMRQRAAFSSATKLSSVHSARGDYINFAIIAEEEYNTHTHFQKYSCRKLPPTRVHQLNKSVLFMCVEWAPLAHTLLCALLQHKTRVNTHLLPDRHLTKGRFISICLFWMVCVCELFTAKRTHLLSVVRRSPKLDR